MSTPPRTGGFKADGVSVMAGAPAVAVSTAGAVDGASVACCVTSGAVVASTVEVANSGASVWVGRLILLNKK